MITDDKLNECTCLGLIRCKLTQWILCCCIGHDLLTHYRRVQTNITPFSRLFLGSVFLQYHYLGIPDLGDLFMSFIQGLRLIRQLIVIMPECCHEVVTTAILLSLSISYVVDLVFQSQNSLCLSGVNRPSHSLLISVNNLQEQNYHCYERLQCL